MAKTVKTPAQKAKEFKDAYGYEQKDETKAQAFSRIASRRTANALEAIRMIEPLSVKSNYEYTKEQAEKIEQALVECVKHVHAVFSGTAKTGKPGFQV